ncbi:GlxA family transcriptional regulator [Aquitalea sp. LB_tupeE]|uniref:GlxA family transcriptional regulator n=1 Tax=Aquitalea sp. LB_tupeE TaxID=2748078 RepID=UPI0015BF37A3|nr:helix-turn-helix domain-containing protein [Aquitalea sp. LB_tupeE]NWK78789.1 helix-turn-helix domain-containing protein [Aquitalea sp. LB_tupeE]
MIDSKTCKVKRIGFLLLNSASVADLSIVTEILHKANNLSNKNHYEYLTLSLDGAPVRLNTGLKLNADLALRHAPSLDYLFIFSTNISDEIALHLLESGIKKQNQELMVLVAMNCASFWLGKLGFLDGKRATIIWEIFEKFSRECPNVIVTSNLYEYDGNCATCAGGASTFDFMHYLLSDHHDHDFITSLAEVFVMERIRNSSHRQRIPLVMKIGNNQPVLTEAVALMEANLSEPLSTAEISRYVGVSTRQLERLFKKYLNKMPSKYYLELRLFYAKTLLTGSSVSILDIGKMSGFSNGPHFTTTYYKHFGVRPREDRKCKLA